MYSVVCKLPSLLKSLERCTDRIQGQLPLNRMNLWAQPIKNQSSAPLKHGVEMVSENAAIETTVFSHIVLRKLLDTGKLHLAELRCTWGWRTFIWILRSCIVNHKVSCTKHLFKADPGIGNRLHSTVSSQQPTVKLPPMLLQGRL